MSQVFLNRHISVNITWLPQDSAGDLQAGGTDQGPTKQVSCFGFCPQVMWPTEYPPCFFSTQAPPTTRIRVCYLMSVINGMLLTISRKLSWCIITIDNQLIQNCSVQVVSGRSMNFNGTGWWIPEGHSWKRWNIAWWFHFYESGKFICCQHDSLLTDDLQTCYLLIIYHKPKDEFVFSHWYTGGLINIA